MLGAKAEADRGGPWTEYRRLVLTLLERHEVCIKEIEDRLETIPLDRERLITGVKDELRQEMERRFAAVRQMAEEIITRDLEQARIRAEQAAKVQVADVTGSWQFRATALTALVSLAVAILAWLTA